MKFIHLYMRVLELLGREAALGWMLALANLALACAMFVEPILFGRIVDRFSPRVPLHAQAAYDDMLNGLRTDANGNVVLRYITPASGYTVRRVDSTKSQASDPVGVTTIAALEGGTEVADQMEEWFSTEACDGFVIAATHTPGAYEDCVRLLVPELQRRKLFRDKYRGDTLRETLGVDRPA